MFNLTHPSLLFRFFKLSGVLALTLLGLLLVIAPITQAASYTYDDTSSPSFADTTCAPAYTVNVPDSFIITDLNYGINVTHIERGGTKITLQSPAGTSVVVLTGIAFDSNDNYAVLLDDSSGNPLDSTFDDTIPGSPPYYTRTAAPNNPLSAFNGQNANGNWTITVCDNIIDGVGGTLNRSSLQFTSASAVGGTAEYVAVDTAKGYAGWLLVGASSLAVVMGLVGGLWVWRQR